MFRPLALRSGTGLSQRDNHHQLSLRPPLSSPSAPSLAAQAGLVDAVAARQNPPITPARVLLTAPASIHIPAQAGPRRSALSIPVAALPMCRFPFPDASRFRGIRPANPEHQANGRWCFQTVA